MEKEQDNKLSFLGVLATLTEQGIRSPVYHKPTFTGQYLNFNSLHPYNVKKRLIRCLQHRAKSISRDIDAYQEEIIILRYNLRHNNYPECIKSAPRNLDRRIEDNTRKLTTVRLPYVNGFAERIQRICSPYYIGTIFTRGSTLRRYLYRIKPLTEFNKIRTCEYSMPCSCGKVYNGETCRPLEIRLEEHPKARWNWKVVYGRPYMERKEKLSAFMG